MRKLVILGAALTLAGCEYSLRIPYPTLEKPSSERMPNMANLAATVAPVSPAFGDTVTLTLTGLATDSYYTAYLTVGDVEGGEPDTPSATMPVPYFRLGNMFPISSTATMSFDLRPHMGQDQNGNPFVLARGQLVKLAFKQQAIKGLPGYQFQSGGPMSFLIQ